MHIPLQELLTLPLSQVYQFVHCALLFSGANTKWKNRTDTEQSEHEQHVAILKRNREKQK